MNSGRYAGLMAMIQDKIQQIGVVRNSFADPADPALIRSRESMLVVEEKFREGLKGLEEHHFIEVVYLFHREKGTDLTAQNYYGESTGVFATRQTCRPSKIGISTVHLLGMDKLVIRVIGLDALDGSPVLDIKPSDRFYEREELSVIQPYH